MGGQHVTTHDGHKHHADMMARAYTPDQAVASVVGSAALEGAVLSPEYIAVLRRITAGEVTVDSVVARIVAEAKGTG
jgi:hypothetical protein